MNKINKMNETPENNQENTQENIKVLPKADISFASPFDDTEFNLRYIFVSEELEIKEQFTALSDLPEGQARKEKKYRVCLNCLVKYAFTDADRQVYDKKFAEYTPKNERILRLAHSTFMDALHGGTDFLLRSAR